MISKSHSEDFQPHPLMRSPHAQTVAAVYLPGARHQYQATRHLVDLDGDDRAVLHDDRPESWEAGQPVVVLLHGLGGCFLSRYMIRIAAKLTAKGIRTFRMDQRACGAGLRLAKMPFHSGRSADVAAAVGLLSELCPASPVLLVGFSMGGNIALKLLGEVGDQPPGNLAGAMAICPPIDLTATVDAIENPRNRVYRRFIMNCLWRQLTLRRRLVPGVKTVRFARRPRGLRELDEVYTAPICGFSDSAAYYRASSALPVMKQIVMHARVLVARDDPVVPYRQFSGTGWGGAVEFHETRHGGHLGFVGQAGRDPDRRWMEWRVVDWVRARSCKLVTTGRTANERECKLIANDKGAGMTDA